MPAERSTAGIMPKLKGGLASQTFGDSAEPEIIGTRYFAVMGCTARVTPEV